MDAINDDDRKKRLQILEKKILDDESVASVDCLLVRNKYSASASHRLVHFFFFSHVYASCFFRIPSKLWLPIAITNR